MIIQNITYTCDVDGCGGVFIDTHHVASSEWFEIQMLRPSEAPEGWTRQGWRIYCNRHRVEVKVKDRAEPRESPV